MCEAPHKYVTAHHIETLVVLSQQRRRRHQSVPASSVGRVPVSAAQFATLPSPKLVICLGNLIRMWTCSQRWMDVGVFFHVSKSAEVFRDDGTPYRFARDEVHSILNMRTRCTGSVRATVEVERDVRDSLHRIVRRAVPEGSW
jgi:hypothetical protein